MSTFAPAGPLSLSTYVQVLRRQRRLIIVVTLLTTLLGSLPAFLEKPTYEATAKVEVSLLDREGVFNTDSGGDPTAVDRARDLGTEIEVLGSAKTRAEVVRRFADPPTFDDPTVLPVGYSNVLSIRVTAPDPGVAADVANTYANVFVEDRRNRSVEDLLDKVDELRTQSSDAQAEYESISQRLASGLASPNEVSNLQLQQSTLATQIQDYDTRADEFDVEASLRGKGTQVVAPAEIELSPISPKPLRAATIGFVLGFLMSLGLAVLVDTVQDRIGSREDLAMAFPSVPVLSSIPGADMSRPDTAGFAVQEAFRYLRTSVRIYGMNAQLRSLMVTSAVPGEGKSTVAANLAMAMAQAGDRVVLVDCDLRLPSLHEHFDLPNDKGLTSLLTSDANLDEVIHFVHDNLAVVVTGPPVANPPEALGAKEFARIVEALTEQADFMILDTPPVLPVADALIAGQTVDGTLVVSRIGLLRRRSLREVMGRLEEAGIPVVGLVANDTDDREVYGDYTESADSRSKAPKYGRHRAKSGGRKERRKRKGADEVAASDDPAVDNPTATPVGS